MYDVAKRFYQKLIPQAREIAHKAEESGNAAAGEAVRAVINELLSRPEHVWYEEQKVEIELACNSDANSPVARA